MGANPHANGGLLLRDLEMPDFRDYAVDIKEHGTTLSEATRVLGGFLRDVMSAQRAVRQLPPLRPGRDRLQPARRRAGGHRPHLGGRGRAGRRRGPAPDGRVMEILSEHMCQGWLEGYLLTGRHGFFSCYEAFIHIVDSMFNQHAKWLKTTRHIPWRRPIASLNYLLTSHVWRQDHNGFSHQDPGFIDHVVNKKAGVIRVYLPPDANTLLSVGDHCLRSKNYVNVIVAGKQPALNWLSMDEAIAHCTRGIGIWEWASTDAGQEPDWCWLRRRRPDAGDAGGHGDPAPGVPGAEDPRRERRGPDAPESDTEHPHGLSDHEFDALFTTDKPVVFAYHGYPLLIHRLTYRRANHNNFHVRGYKEEGTTTTPFDMVMMNDLDRYHLVIDAIDRVPALAERGAHLRQQMIDARLAARAYTREYGDDIPEVRDWVWPLG
jgi:xylulose-5-phosphate/fructose-6-phosphate phosphoketolase